MSWKEEIIKRKRPNKQSDIFVGYGKEYKEKQDEVSKRLQMAANELYEIMKNELTGNEPFEALKALEEMLFDPQYRADR
tara:strand:+ start:35 stop:271 length:237 start_codon:yes stop_codon:yes gene_type:complete